MKTLSMRVKDAEKKLGRLKEKQKLIKMKADVKRQQALVKRKGVSTSAPRPIDNTGKIGGGRNKYEDKKQYDPFGRSGRI